MTRPGQLQRLAHFIEPWTDATGAELTAGGRCQIEATGPMTNGGGYRASVRRRVTYRGIPLGPESMSIRGNNIAQRQTPRYLPK